MDKFKDYLAVLKRHKDCIDAPAAAILWIVDNGTVTRSKYQIPKTHHNPPRCMFLLSSPFVHLPSFIIVILDYYIVIDGSCMALFGIVVYNIV